MKSTALLSSLGLAAVLGLGILQPAPAQEIVSGKNRFSLNSRLGFNIAARFQNLAVAPHPGANPPATAQARNYDNGYVRWDTSNNRFSDTWYWGASQYDDTAANFTLTSTTSPADGYAKQKSDDPQFGAEFSYGRELARLGSRHGGIVFGVGASFGYTALDIRHRASLAGNIVHTADTFAFVDTPTPAPFYGNFDGPNPRIGTVPTRALTTTAATASIANRLKGDLYGIKFGPFFEIPLLKRVSLQLDGGVAAVYADCELSWSESVAPAAAAPVRPAVKANRSDWLIGGYVAGRVNVDLGRHWNVFVGAEYQNVGSLTAQGGAKKATLDLGSSIFVNTGLGFSF